MSGHSFGVKPRWRIALLLLAVLVLVLATVVASRGRAEHEPPQTTPSTQTVVSEGAGPTPARSDRVVSFSSKPTLTSKLNVADSDFQTVETGRNKSGLFITGQGRLTHGAPVSDNAASYLELQNGTKSVGRMGVDVIFPDSKAGSVALLAWQTPLTSSAPNGRLVGKLIPNAGIYFVVSVGGWTVGLWDAKSAGQIVLARGSYAATGGVAVSYQVDRDGDIVQVTDPSGRKSEVRDPRIRAWTGPWATWQFYEPTPTARPAEVSRIWFN